MTQNKEHFTRYRYQNVHFKHVEHFLQCGAFASKGDVVMLNLITQVQNVRQEVQKNPPVSMRKLFAGVVYNDLA